jgi:uncharacterized protein with HEPN domain
MKKDSVVYLKHIQLSISKIKEYTKELDEDAFLKSSLIQDAVIRNFEIIGEATKKLSDDIRRKYPQVEWKKIAGMRDKLIHDYMGIDLWAVWAVVEKIIPELELQIETIIKSESA